eukprot:m.4187 g.4187  ORF g.4187 m.4187 type:complete len:678 (-) comp3837_c0_seq1:1234-3267(-)
MYYLVFEEKGTKPKKKAKTNTNNNNNVANKEEGGEVSDKNLENSNSNNTSKGTGGGKCTDTNNNGGESEDDTGDDVTVNSKEVADDDEVLSTNKNSHQRSRKRQKRLLKGMEKGKIKKKKKGNESPLWSTIRATIELFEVLSLILMLLGLASKRLTVDIQTVYTPTLAPFNDISLGGLRQDTRLLQLRPTTKCLTLKENVMDYFALKLNVHTCAQTLYQVTNPEGLHNINNLRVDMRLFRHESDAKEYFSKFWGYALTPDFTSGYTVDKSLGTSTIGDESHVFVFDPRSLPKDMSANPKVVVAAFRVGRCVIKALVRAQDGVGKTNDLSEYALRDVLNKLFVEHFQKHLGTGWVENWAEYFDGTINGAVRSVASLIRKNTDFAFNEAKDMLIKKVMMVEGGEQQKTKNEKLSKKKKAQGKEGAKNTKRSPKRNTATNTDTNNNIDTIANTSSKQVHKTKDSSTNGVNTDVKNNSSNSSKATTTFERHGGDSIRKVGSVVKREGEKVKNHSPPDVDNLVGEEVMGQTAQKDMVDVGDGTVVQVPRVKDNVFDKSDTSATNNNNENANERNEWDSAKSLFSSSVTFVMGKTRQKEWEESHSQLVNSCSDEGVIEGIETTVVDDGEKENKGTNVEDMSVWWLLWKLVDWNESQVDETSSLFHTLAMVFIAILSLFTVQML